MAWKAVEHDIPSDKTDWKSKFGKERKAAREAAGIKGSNHKEDAKWAVAHGTIENEAAARKHVEEMEAKGMRKAAGAKNKPY
jgi:hypothetical protein